MKNLSWVVFFIATTVFSGCASIECAKKDGEVLQRTDTAVVGFYLDEKGYAHPTVDLVTVKPGQRVIFVGPSRFDVFFKDGRAPTEKREFSSENGIIIIDVPKDIFEKNRRPSSGKDVVIKELLFRYGVRVNGLVTDPTIRVIPS